MTLEEAYQKWKKQRLSQPHPSEDCLHAVWSGGPGCVCFDHCELQATHPTIKYGLDGCSNKCPDFEINTSSLDMLHFGRLLYSEYSKHLLLDQYGIDVEEIDEIKKQREDLEELMARATEHVLSLPDPDPESQNNIF